MGNRDRRLAAAIAALLTLMLLATGWGLSRQSTAQPVPGPNTVAPGPVTGTPTMPPSPAAPTASPSATPRTPTPPTASATATAPPPGGDRPTHAVVCSPTAAPMASPRRLIMARTGVSAPVISVGTDASGAAGAPPKNQSRTVAWWRNGPKIGSDRGQAVLTIHSYRNGGALGNEMYAGGEKWVVGDVIQIVDGRGNVACYRLRAITKLWVSDYDPRSTVLYDDAGDPRLVIVICWDFQRRTQLWASRILFVADKMN